LSQKSNPIDFIALIVYRMENLSHEVNQLQSSLIMKEAKWAGREHSYRRTIDDLEGKV